MNPFEAHNLAEDRVRLANMVCSWNMPLNNKEDVRAKKCKMCGRIFSTHRWWRHDYCGSKSDKNSCSYKWAQSYAQRNSESVRAQRISHYQENKARLAEARRIYYKENREKVRMKLRKTKLRRLLRDPEEFYNTMSKRAKRARENIRNEILSVLGRKCVRCGFDDLRALQVDHVNGDGSKDKLVLSRWYVEKMKNNLSNYQLLCANCNWIKRHENQEIAKVPRQLKESKLYKLASSLYE